MTDNEVRAINRKLDEALGILAETRIQVAEVRTDVKAHIARDDERRLDRELTCPQRETIAGNARSIDAVAGIVRTMGINVAELMKWREQEDKDDLVIAARVGPLKRFSCWLGDNLKDILIAVTIAYVLFALRLK